MKTILFAFVACLCLTLPLKAQDLTPPKNGAVLRMAETQHQLALGENLSADVWLVRSRANHKTAFEGLTVNGAPGILVKFAAHNQDPDRYVMNISVAPGMEPGRYTLLVKGRGQNAYRLRGTTFSLEVTEQLNVTN